MDPERLAKIESIFKTVVDGVTQGEFVAAFQRVVEYVRAFQDQFATAFETLKADLFERVDNRLAKVTNGVDGKDGKDGRNGIDGTNGRDGADGAPGRDGIDGRDGSPDTPIEVRDKLETLQGEERLDKTAIKGIDDLEARIEKNANGGVRVIGGRAGIYLYIDGVKKGLVQTINLIPGTGVTISHNPRYGRNDVTITATGTASLAPIAVTGTIDDTNKSFTAASSPNLVIVNGASYRDGHGATIVGTAITLDNPVGTGGDIYGL